MKKKIQSDLKTYEKLILIVCASVIILSFILLDTFIVTYWWLFALVLAIDVLIAVNAIRLSELPKRFALFINVVLSILALLYVLDAYNIWFS